MTWNIKVVLNKKDEKKTEQTKGNSMQHVSQSHNTASHAVGFFFFLEGLNIVKYKCVLNKISHSF